MPSSAGRNNIRNQLLYLPNGGDPAQFNVAEADFPQSLRGAIGGVATIVFGAGSATDPKTSKTVQLVRTDSQMAVAPYDGAAAYWKDQQNYQVTTDSTGRLGRGAGAFLTTITPGNLALIQTGGLKSVKFIDVPTNTPTAAGLAVISHATAGKFDSTATAPTGAVTTFGKTAGVLQGGTGMALVELDVPSVT